MAEQLAVEVDVKNVTEDGRKTEHTGQAPLRVNKPDQTKTYLIKLFLPY